MRNAFVDSNILVHALVEGPLAEPALAILADAPETSIQAVNELVSVVRRKWGFSLAKAVQASEYVFYLCAKVHGLTPADHRHALDLVERHKFAWWDALLLAVAIRTGARRFVSEDLQHGRSVDGVLEIVNPFV